RAPAEDERVLKQGEKVQQVVIEGATYIDVPALLITGAIVHVGLDPNAGKAVALQAQRPLLAITLLALVVAALISLSRGARGVGPRRELPAPARRIVEGDLSHEVHVTSSDEV